MSNNIDKPEVEIKIFQKTCNFYLNLRQRVIKFPKVDRFSLGQKLESTTLEILELLFLVNSKEGKSKELILNKIKIKFNFLKTLVRLAFKARCISQKGYIDLEKRLQEICKEFSE